MKLIQNLLNKKTSKKALIIASILAVIQILIAARPIIKPISWMKDTTLFYSIVAVELIIFPIVLLIILSYFVEKIKWLDKKSFLVTFIITAWILVSIIILGQISSPSANPPIPREFWLLYQYLEGPLLLAGLPAIPLALLLGWRGWSMFNIIGITGIFILSLIISTLFSFTTHLALKKKRKIFRKLLIGFLVLLIGWGIFQSINKAYVWRSHLEGKCQPWLNFYECENYTDLGNWYHKAGNDIYFSSNKIDGADAESFESIDHPTARLKFAKDKNYIYADGEIIPVNNIDSWRLLDGEENWGYSTDGENVFYGVSILEGVNPQQIYVLDGSYACGDQFVYNGYKIIEGADPNSFVTLNWAGSARDDDYYYFYGERTKSVQEAGERSDLEIVSRCSDKIMGINQ